ncbi:MAG: manganese efflux pump [Alicyclobacillaceae bacterium]|nr:manganese efflux pump [Alicyclobacillaceae bacterium]
MAGFALSTDWPAEQWATLVLLAIALGLDAFSVGVGVGLKRPKRGEIVLTSAAVGALHVVLPLVGLELGLHLHYMVGDLARWLGACVLILIGVHMVWHSMRDQAADWMREGVGAGWLLYAFGVSLDSLTAGFGLGLFDVDPWVASLLFGAAGACLSAAGLSLGGRVGEWLGGYSEAVGGALLIAVGCHFLL